MPETKRTTFCLNCGNTIDSRLPVCERCGSKRMKAYLSAADWQLVTHLRKINGLEIGIPTPDLVDEDAHEEPEAATDD
jgi:hypothetical protein